MAPPTLDEYYIRTPLLPFDPQSAFAQKTLAADVRACGKDDSTNRRVLVDPTGNTVYFPAAKDVSPKTTFLNIDDALLRRILSSKGGLGYQLTDDKGRPAGVTGTLRLCRSASPVSGSGAAARYELYTAYNQILSNGPKNPNLLKPLSGIQLSDAEIVGLVQGFGLDSSEYAVSQDASGNFFLPGNFDRISDLVDWLKGEPMKGKPTAASLFLNDERRKEITQAIFETIAWESYTRLFAKIGTAAAIIGIGATAVTTLIIRNQSKSQKDAMMGNVEVTPEERKQIMKSVTVDLTEEARQGRLDPVLGREKEIRRILTILEANDLSGANIPALFGDKGVGKTAIAEGIALDIVSGKLPQYAGWSVVEIKIPALVEGAGVLGAFEKKMGVVIGSLQNTKNTLFFMDEIHMIMGLGKTKDSKIDAAQMLKTAMARAGLKVIVGTTEEEYKQHIKPDPAFESRLTPVIVNPVGPEVRSKILQGLRTNFLAKVEKFEKDAGKTPSKINIPDDVLEHFGDLMGTNTREIKKALALVIVQLKNANPGNTITVSIQDVDNIIEEINETRRALGQDEFVGTMKKPVAATAAPTPPAPHQIYEQFLDRIGLNAAERANIAPGELAEAIVLRLTGLGAPADLTQEIMLLDKVMTKRPDLFSDQDECVRQLLTERLEGIRNQTTTPKTTAAVLEAYADRKKMKDADKDILLKAARVIDGQLEKARKEEKEKREAAKK